MGSVASSSHYGSLPAFSACQVAAPITLGGPGTGGVGYGFNGTFAHLSVYGRAFSLTDHLRLRSVLQTDAIKRGVTVQ